MSKLPNSRGLNRNFYRNGPDVRGGQDVSFADIQREYNFYAVRIGRWVTPAEQQRAANLFYDALYDLSAWLQVPPQVISLQGQLGLHFAIGGQRHSCAHYEPAARVLALAKNAGGGSLAHEWFHAFDHYICTHMFSQVKQLPSGAFASSTWLQQDYTPHPLNELLHKAFKALYLNTSGDGPSDFMQHCLRVDQALGRVYFSMPEEMAARSFEHMLQLLPSKNHFLVSGTLQSDTAQAGLYPPDTIQAQFGAAILGYFHSLGAALQRREQRGVVK
ncbi:MAG: hypothetical protein M1473_03525 [Firmicutes bacterium]|nr:hypothetical protein [Bacillota bacterium]